MEKNNFSPVQKLIKYLKLEFIVDKGVDFILIFVGLYAALSLENSIKENENQEKYIQDLKNIYVEISKNKVSSIEMESAINKFSGYIDSVLIEISEQLNLIEPTNPSSLQENRLFMAGIHSESRFNYNSFNTLDKNIFMNKILLKIIYDLYSLYDQTAIMNEDYLNSIIEICKLHYMKNKFETGTNLTYMIIRALDLKEINIGKINFCFSRSNEVMNALEKELEKFNIEKKSILSIKDSYDIASLYLYAGKYSKAYEILIRKLPDITDVFMLGNYYEKLGYLILNNLQYNIEDLSSLNLTLEDAENYFNKCLEIGHEKEYTNIYLANLYYFKNDDEKFYFHLENGLKAGFDNFDQIKVLFGDKKFDEKFIFFINNYKK